MPQAAPRPCTHPGCGKLVHDGSGRCERHPRPAWAKKVNAPKRITGRRLQALRAELFARNPLCAECERQGRVRLATQRDHVISLGEEGTEDDDNVQGLCADCHAEKSLAESIRSRSPKG
jgi:5-methylcytosine-specific restriction enzyme A